VINKLYIENILINVVTQTLLLKTLSLFLALEWTNQIIVFRNCDINNTKHHLIFQIVFQKTSTPCWRVLCKLRTDDVIWYWQLHYCSKMTIVSLFMSHDCLVYITIYTHAQARTVVFPWTPNFQFILDITSDSKVFPTHHYELW